MRTLKLLLILFLLYSCSLPELETPPQQRLRILPNPAQEYVLLSVIGLAGQPFTITVIDPDGDVILEEHAAAGLPDSFTIDLSQHPDGYYFAILETGKEKYTQKFIKR